MEQPEIVGKLGPGASFLPLACCKSLSSLPKRWPAIKADNVFIAVSDYTKYAINQIEGIIKLYQPAQDTLEVYFLDAWKLYSAFRLEFCQHFFNLRR